MYYSQENFCIYFFFFFLYFTRNSKHWFLTHNISLLFSFTWNLLLCWASVFPALGCTDPLLSISADRSCLLHLRLFFFSPQGFLQLVYSSLWSAEAKTRWNTSSKFLSLLKSSDGLLYASYRLHPCLHPYPKEHIAFIDESTECNMGCSLNHDTAI